MNNPTTFAPALGLLVLGAMALPSPVNAAEAREFEAKLSGEQQVTAVESTGRGRAEARFNRAFRFVNVEVVINDLVGTVTAAHFHCARPGENGPVVFGLISPGPLALNGNRIQGTLTNADYTGSDCTTNIGRQVNNMASLAFAMRDGLIYVNVHTDTSPSGEVRGQMVESDDDATVSPAGN